MANGRIRVEIHTPEGKSHVCEEALSSATIALLREAERDPSPKNRMKVLDAIVERGMRSVVRCAGAVSKSLRGR